MGKKKKRGKADPVAAESQPISHNPFAVLSGAKVPTTTSAVTSAVTSAPADAAPPTDAPRRSASTFLGKVVVRRESKGRGGKTVTRVSGLSVSQLEEFMPRMKRALGCGAAVEDEDLVLLGSLVERAATWLEAEGAPRVIRGN